MSELWTLTSPPLLDLLGPLDGPRGSLLLLLLGAAPVEVLHHDPHEHVEHEEADQQQEGDEVQQPPLVVVLARLHAHLDRLKLLKILFY